MVLDGYLYKANICLDKNNNAICDSGDGNIALSDTKGNYQLEIEGDISRYNLLVEAIPGKTVDMDNPNQSIQSAFTLEVPASAPSVISPLTAMIASIADSSGISFNDASEAVASELNVASNIITTDYAASSNGESKKIHMLARGITRILQIAQYESMQSGVSQENARKGSRQKLAQLDIRTLKQQTDLLSHGSVGANQVLKQLGQNYHEQLKVTPEEIAGGKIVIYPPAPKGGEVNDSADTFNWDFVLGFQSIRFYEYSTITAQLGLQSPENHWLSAAERIQ